MKNLQSKPNEVRVEKAIKFGKDIIREIGKSRELNLEELVVASLFNSLLRRSKACLAINREGLRDELYNMLRVSLETYISLCYIIQKRKFIKDRATSYCVGYLKQQQTNIETGENVANLQSSLNLIASKLEKEAYQRVINEWENARNKSEGKYTPKWYSLFNGPTSFAGEKGLIKKVLEETPAYKNQNKTAIFNTYKNLYGYFSQDAHGYNAIDNIILDQSTLQQPLGGEDTDNALQLSVSFLVYSLKLIGENVFPEYKKDIQFFIRSMY
ncbi:DUF5677 domain-containing protein [Priestia megaterium]|uniref:DUF5677 domain-containing protein n=1 Tax=Priestia megaterium TaxID=1404 RepID=UPI002E20F7F4|nr:DUF5677 domain-containing protein [Priestia megaterium]